MLKPKPKNAFSLIELSITITVISLIIGLILLISTSADNARLTIISSEQSAFKRAVKSFRNYYESYPGDMANAYDLLGSDCGSDASVETTGCNGDGNEKVDTSKESYMVAKHLYVARLLSKEYSGVSTSPNYEDIYVNSLFKSGFYSPMIHSSVSYNSANNGSFNKRHFIVFGARPSDDSIPYDPILTPAEAEKIDGKIDDGFAFEGLVQIRYNDATDCNGSSDGNQIGNYDIATDSKECNLLFYID